MLRLILRRLALGLVTILLVSLIIFVGVEALPGHACTAALQQDARGEPLRVCREQLGLNVPAYQRYFTWAFGAVQGDLGVAFDGRRIATIVGDRLKNTLLLAASAIAFGVPVALFLGIVTALRRDKATDLILSTAAIMATCSAGDRAAWRAAIPRAVWRNTESMRRLL